MLGVAPESDLIYDNRILLRFELPMRILRGELCYLGNQISTELLNIHP